MATNPQDVLNQFTGMDSIHSIESFEAIRIINAMASTIADRNNALSEAKLSKMRLQLALCEVAQTLLALSKQA